MPQLPPFDYTPMPYDGPSPEEILALRKQFVNPAIFHYYKKPIMIVEGKGQYLFDETGRRYLDGFGGVLRLRGRRRHHAGDGIADEADAVGRQRLALRRVGFPVDPDQQRVELRVRMATTEGSSRTTPRRASNCRIMRLSSPEPWDRLLCLTMTAVNFAA